MELERLLCGSEEDHCTFIHEGPWGHLSIRRHKGLLIELGLVLRAVREVSRKQGLL